MPPLVDLALLIRGTVTRIGDAHGLTPVQGRLLCVLVNGPLRMSDLAAQMGVEKAALTGLVDRAERRQLVSRQAVPGDRRAVHVMLSERGTRVVGEFQAAVDDALDEMLAPLDPEQRALFQTMTAAIVDR